MKESKRLYFLDALRAFAILMMLQGHFVSGILDPLFKDTTNSVYNLWLYCRGFTAPVFFTVTGWVVLFLLLKNPIQGLQNPRIKKGLKRGLELILWGYVLQNCWSMKNFCCSAQKASSWRPPIPVCARSWSPRRSSSGLRGATSTWPGNRPRRWSHS